jgi:MSHA pilin protein MshA
MSKAARGFTLIELVVVIVILGILAAFAVPRFMGLERQARISSLQALNGSVRSAAALAHSVWLVDGTSPATISVEGTSVAMTNGYPDAAALVSTLQDTTGFTPTVAAGVLTFTRVGAPTAANCSFTYAPPASANGAPTISTPVITGC